MKTTTKQSRTRISSDESALCQFPYADGRQCRMFRHKSHASLCLFHAREEQRLLELDRIGEELASLSGSFKTVSDIHHVIGKLFKLVAANRIPARNAQLLAYLSQLLLYAQRGVRHEITSAQGYHAWERALHQVYPAPPPRPRDPLPKTAQGFVDKLTGQPLTPQKL